MNGFLVNRRLPVGRLRDQPEQAAGRSLVEPHQACTRNSPLEPPFTVFLLNVPTPVLPSKLVHSRPNSARRPSCRLGPTCRDAVQNALNADVLIDIGPVDACAVADDLVVPS